MFSSIKQGTTVEDYPGAVCGKTLLFGVVVNHYLRGTTETGSAWIEQEITEGTEADRTWTSVSPCFFSEYLAAGIFQSPCSAAVKRRMAA